MPSKNYDDLTKDELIQLLQARDRRDATRFGLVWEANEIERDRALNQDFVALDLDPELSCPARAEAWKNLIIEGDYFDALRYLKMTFAGRVKCIYIDPPYNTGNKDFVYNDRFVDKEDLWRHSKWCEFMYQRLTLAKDLLTQDGIIFVSIDDNELHDLGILLRQIFSESNFLGTMIWHNVTDNNPTRISVEHEYILCFARNSESVAKVWKANTFPMKEKLIELGRSLVRQYPDQEERQTVYTKWFRENKAYMWPFDRYKYIDDGGIYTGSQSVHNPGKEGFRYDVLHPVTAQPCKEPLMGYRFAPDTMKQLLEDNRILFGD